MQKGKKNTTSDFEYYKLEDQSVQDAVNEGVMPDKLSIRVVTFWSVLISFIVIVLIAIAFNLYKYFKFEQEYRAAVNTEYRELNNLRSQAHENLSVTEVIDPEQGIYRIPVDSAMSVVVRNYQEN